MDPMALQFAKFSISNNNNSKNNNQNAERGAEGMNGNICMGGVNNVVNQGGNSNEVEKQLQVNNISGRHQGGIYESQRGYVGNMPKVSSAGGNKPSGASNVETKPAAYMNNAIIYPSAGFSGGGDAPYLGPFPGTSSISSATAMNIPRFINDTPYRNLGFEFTNYQFSERARKRFLDRQFRQVEMGNPCGSDYSRKVFVGGLPPDIFESSIQERFSQFGGLTVDWPHKLELNSVYPPKGYAFLLFNEDSSVRRLISACDSEEGRLYITVSSQTMKDKPVQIRPWRVADSDYVPDMNINLDPRKTVFIGGVPRPIRAYDLAVIMNRLFGGVCYAGIDTDTEFKYPKGAGRVTFYNHHSYVAAISARFVQLQHEDIEKRVEVKPYVLDDQQCDECQGKSCNYKYARFFCSNITCLRYYCDECWQFIHSTPGREYHKPLVKEGNERPRAVHYRWGANKN